MENPIIDNRIVNDKTFAVRFKSFLNGIQANDMVGEEELDYLKYVADKLVTYQLATVETDEEKAYFENLKMM
jgi:hypothetical protein